MVHSPDGDTDFSDIVARVEQRDTFAPNMFIISLDYIIGMSVDLVKASGFALKNELWKMQTTQMI